MGLAKVVAHAHVKPCAQGKGGGHWMHDATKAKSDTSNKLYVLGPVGRWYKTMAAWKVNSGSAISGVQETRPRSIVVHDPDTMAKALCCDLKWDDGWDLTPAPKSPVRGTATRATTARTRACRTTRAMTARTRACRTTRATTARTRACRTTRATTARTRAC